MFYIIYFSIALWWVCSLFEVVKHSWLVQIYAVLVKPDYRRPAKKEESIHHRRHRSYGLQLCPQLTRKLRHVETHRTNLTKTIRVRQTQERWERTETRFARRHRKSRSHLTEQRASERRQQPLTLMLSYLHSVTVGRSIFDTNTRLKSWVKSTLVSKQIQTLRLPAEKFIKI